MAKAYIVYREIQDLGPNGSLMGYVKVTNPGANEKIYHGKFAPRSVSCGQFDADSRTVYDAVGEVTWEIYGESAGANVETF